MAKNKHKKLYQFPIIFLMILIFLIPFVINEKYKDIISNNIINSPKIIEEKPNKISILFFGDVMLGRYVEILSIDNNNYPFEKINSFIKNSNSDVVYVNLEGPIMDPHYKTKSGSTVFSFRKEASNILKDNGINLVSLANNHMRDYGISGYTQTQSFLKNDGISFFGDYYNDENIFIEKIINGKSFIFFGFNMINRDFEKNISENKKYILDEIISIRKKYSDSFFIVFPHWGNEYKIKSNSIQQDFAHEIIDNGADLIIGGHPHVTQENEIYNDKYIFYSLGNFVFDQYFSDETQQMIGVKLDMSCLKNKCENNFEIIPIKSEASQPSIIDDEEEKIKFLEKYNLNK